MNPVSHDGPATTQPGISYRNATTVRRCGLLVLLLMLVSAVLWACGGEASPALSLTPLSPTATDPTASPTLAAPTATYESGSPIPFSPTAAQPPTTPTAIPPFTATPTPINPQMGCSLGTGLREETAAILMGYKDHPGLVMSSSSELAGVYFPQLEGWIRVLGAPSLESLRQKAERAEQTEVPYEALGYGLETGRSTPNEEWQDLMGATHRARDIANQYDRLLVMGPGFRLMSQNEDKYPQMAALTDVWMFQTQRLQIDPPGPDYRQEVERIVNLIKSGNPDISIWAQITLPPDREPDAEEWLAYRQSIADLVDGTYVGVYTWESTDPELLVATIETIFGVACVSDQ
jgi:hypothetical protein